MKNEENHENRCPAPVRRHDDLPDGGLRDSGSAHSYGQEDRKDLEVNPLDWKDCAVWLLRLVTAGILVVGILLGLVIGKIF